MTHPAQGAHRVLRRLEHYTPKYASFLIMVEIEIGLLSGQCLGRRISDGEHLSREITGWQKKRNAAGEWIEWKFTTKKAPTSSLVSILTPPKGPYHGDEVDSIELLVHLLSTGSPLITSSNHSRVALTNC